MEDVKQLFADGKASTIIFSPPYKARRKYVGGETLNSTHLFESALRCAPCAEDVQAFSVIGNLHCDGQQDMYYEPWIAAVQKEGWRRFSTYVWDKGHGLPGAWNGRLAPCHEWIIHLNKRARFPRKHVKTIWGEGRHFRKDTYRTSRALARQNADHLVSDYKIADSVIRVNPGGRCAGINHPAIFPIELPLKLLQSFHSDDGVIYDPMSGSGSTMLAAETLELPSVMMEIAPEYCEIAVERYHKHIEKIDSPSKPKRKVVT